MSRTVQYVDGAGNVGADPVRVSASAVAAAWLKQTSRIPATFAVGTALHEAGYATNELDTEPSGKQTAGIFQLTVGGTVVDTFGDASKALMPEKSYYDLDDACAIFAVLMTRNLDHLLAASGLDEGTFWARGGAAYLAWSHNAGLYDRTKEDGTKTIGPLTSINNNGLDWPAARARNANLPYFRDRIGPYGDDVVSGGPDWSDDMATLPEVADANGNFTAAAAPLIDAITSSRLRLGLVVLLLALLVALRWPSLVTSARKAIT